MTKLTRDALARRQFADRRHYPYGFARSGDFSIRESQLLSQHGSLIAALLDGQLLPESPQEQGYIDVAMGKRHAESAVEKVWYKYQTRINRPKTGSIYGCKGGDAAIADAADSLDEDNDDLPLADDDIVNKM